MAQTISETETKIYLLLRDNPEVRLTTEDIATRIGVGVRAVQRRLTRLGDVVETTPTKPPRHRVGLRGRAGRAMAKKLDEAAMAYGLVQEPKEARTGR